MAKILGDLFNIYHKVVMSILEIILTILTTFFFVHCGENDVKTDLFKEGLILFDDPSVDGCGWLIYNYTDSTGHKPVNLAPENKKDSLEVLFTFDRLNSYHICGFYQFNSVEIEITNIRPYPVWGFYQPDYEEMVITDIKLKSP